MKCETRDKKEIKKFIKFCQTLLFADSDDIRGTLTINKAGITYSTDRGTERYHLPFDDVLMFSSRRQSFRDEMCGDEKSFHPNISKWTITKPELPPNKEIDWKAYVSYPEPEK